MSKWFVKGKKRNYGPYDSIQIDRLFTLGKISDSTEISTDEKRWNSLSSGPLANMLGLLEDTSSEELELVYVEAERRVASHSQINPFGEKTTVSADESTLDNDFALCSKPIEGKTHKTQINSDKPKSGFDDSIGLPLSVESIKERVSVKSIEPARKSNDLDLKNDKFKAKDTARLLSKSNSIDNINAPIEEDEYVIESKTIYNDILMIILAVMPIFVGIGLIFSSPWWILVLTYFSFSIGLVLADGIVLNKLNLDSPHWYFTLLTPIYMKRRELVIENTYFFSLSTFSFSILAGVILMYCNQ